MVLLVVRWEFLQNYISWTSERRLETTIRIYLFDTLSLLEFTRYLSLLDTRVYSILGYTKLNLLEVGNVSTDFHYFHHSSKLRREERTRFTEWSFTLYENTPMKVKVACFPIRNSVRILILNRWGIPDESEFELSSRVLSTHFTWTKPRDENHSEGNPRSDSLPSWEPQRSINENFAKIIRQVQKYENSSL